MRGIAIALAVLATASPVLAQQRGSDVGGQPARRKLTKMPRLVHFVEADYPAAEKAAGTSASVVLTIEIGATGKVTAVSVAESASPAFDAAAVAAAARFEFDPAEVDDKPAPARITYRYDFVSPPVPPTPLTSTPTPLTPTPTPTPTPTSTSTSTPTPTSTPTVQIRARPRERRQAVDYAIGADQAKKVAGTQGDVLKVVQNLPGVSRPPLASGQIVVWGSAPNDTRVYVDGVDLPALYHGSGLRGTINSDLVASIDLVPGAFGAEYGRGLGGLVRVETRALPRGTHGYVGADTLDGSAFASTELGDHVRIGTALRYGWLDALFAACNACSTPSPRSGQAASGVHDVGDYFPIPRYRDAQVKATFDLGKRESVDTVLLLSSDELDRTVPSTDPAKRRVESSRLRFWRAYARYTNVSERGDTSILTPFFGQDSRSLVQSFGPTPAHLEVDSTRYGLRGSLRSPLGRNVVLVTGMDALGTASTVTRDGSLTLPPREGDISVFGQPPGDEYAVDAWKTNILDIGPHVSADIRLGPVTVTPGARLDAYVIEGNRKIETGPNVPPVGFTRLETAAAPRASARWEVTPRFALTAAYGKYHQAPEPEELSAVFGTPALGLSRATHITAGESLRITDSLVADVVAFDKRMSDLVVRSRLVNPLRGRVLVQNGEGHSYGVQLFLRQELWHGFFGWASYAITRSERRYEGDPSWRRFDFDQPHVLSLVGSQELGPWTFGARFRFASGNPRTPVEDSAYDSRSDRFDPVFGPQNSIRIPSFWQLDVRADRSFSLGHDTRALVFLDLQNVTNHQNAEELAYSSNYRQRGTITGLPFIAVLGARVER